jgi:hypothetical protein
MKKITDIDQRLKPYKLLPFQKIYIKACLSDKKLILPRSKQMGIASADRVLKEIKQQLKNEETK